MFRIYRNPEGEGQGGGEGGEVKFSAEQQKAVDRIVATRLARQKEQFADYDNLRQFKDEHEKGLEAQKQKDLETSKKYDEAKAGYETKIKGLSEALVGKDRTIETMTIDFNLTNEISKQNGYLEESLALLRGTALLKEGKIYIKGKDSNGLDTELPVEEGVKRFLTSRPHLVKASVKGGGGTPPSGNGGGRGDGNGSAGAEGDLTSLNLELQGAMQRGDRKKTAEIKNRIIEILKAKNQLAVRR